MSLVVWGSAAAREKVVTGGHIVLTGRRSPQPEYASCRRRRLAGTAASQRAAQRQASHRLVASKGLLPVVRREGVIRALGSTRRPGIRRYVQSQGERQVRRRYSLPLPAITPILLTPARAALLA